MSLLQATEGPGTCAVKGAERTEAALETRRSAGTCQGFSQPAVLSTRTAQGLLREKTLMWSPVPANQGSEPLAHSFVLPTPKSERRNPESRTWGFPSLGRRRLGLPPHPRPKCQVSSRGGGGLRGLPSRAAQTAKSTLSPRWPRPRARARTRNTLIHIHTRKHMHRHTRTGVLPRRRRRGLLAARTF